MLQLVFESRLIKRTFSTGWRKIGMSIIDDDAIQSRIIFKPLCRRGQYHLSDDFRISRFIVACSIQLQFHLLPGWFDTQDGWSTGKVSFFSQNRRCVVSGFGDVVGIQRKLGITSLLRSNSCQSAAKCARAMAVLYSVCSHVRVWWEAMPAMSFRHCEKLFNCPFSSRNRRDISLSIACTLNAANTELECFIAR